MGAPAVAAVPRPPVQSLPGDAILTTADGRQIRFDSLLEMTPGAPVIGVTLPDGTEGAAGRDSRGAVMAVRKADRQRFDLPWPDADAYCVTLIRDQARPLGKLFAADGTKTAVVSVSRGTAETVRCATHDDLARLLERVGNDEHAALIPDYFAGIPVGEVFEIHSEPSLRNAIGRPGQTRSDVLGIFELPRGRRTIKAVTRWKENVAPSVWQVIDRDINEHTPQAFAELDDGAYFAALAKALPGIDQVTRVRTLSSSARALRDGRPLGGSAGHTWIMLSDPAAKERLRVVFRTQAIVTGIAWPVPRFSRVDPSKRVGSGWACLADDAPMDPGRLVFCGAPLSVDSEVISIRPQVCTVERGSQDALDVTSLRVADAGALRAASHAGGCEVGLSRSGRGTLSIFEASLSLDDEVETERDGVLTIRGAIDLLSPPGAPGKLRCQAPRRASESFAAYMFLNDGEPRIHDSGMATTYLLDGAALCLLDFGDLDNEDDAHDDDGVAKGPEAPYKGGESADDPEASPSADASATAVSAALTPVLDTTVVTPIDGSLVARPRATPATPGRRQAATLPVLLTALRIPAACGWRIGRDDFSSSVMISPAGEKPPQWRKLTDTDNTQIREHLERHHGLGSIGKEAMRDAIDLVAAENRFDSAQTWLGRLEWDGVPRVEGFLRRYFGAEDTPYTRAASRYICTAMAGRILQPGVKADMVPVAVGGQGTRKSTTIAALVPDPMYFAEVALDARDADTVRLVRGKLVVELAELSGMRRRDAESLKAFLSATNDQLIEKYREHSITLPRRCVFFGSSNRDDFLTDSTGSRRWLPFRSGACDPEALERDRDQLWAEAAAMFKAGGVDHAEAERLARAEHEQFAEIDAWDAEIERCLSAGPVPGRGEEARCAFGKGPPDFVTSREVLSAAGLVTGGRITRADEMRAAECLKRLGWRRDREMRDGMRRWGFARP
ncbi:MAG: hypothetical protein KGN16_20085 [Burkholderiales bacterium]|nr:hypothetical protein [Burkholderiales bacterium]